MKARSEYGQLQGLASPLLERLRLQWAIRHIPQGSSVLEIGCGRAAILEYPHLHPIKYVGLDIIPELIERNRLRHPGHEFHRLNAEDEDLVSLGRFDVVLMLALIEHLSGPEGLIRKVKALLQNGGQIILTTPHPRGEWALKMGSHVGLWSRESQAEHRALLSRDELYRLAASGGFRDILYRSFLFGMNQLLILRA